MARPIPRPAPVTRAVLPSRRKGPGVGSDMARCGTKQCPSRGKGGVRYRQDVRVTRSERYVAFLLSALPEFGREAALLAGLAAAAAAVRACSTRPCAGSATARPGARIRGLSRRQPARLGAAAASQLLRLRQFRRLAEGRPARLGHRFRLASSPSLPANCRLIPGWFATRFRPFCGARRRGGFRQYRLRHLQFGARGVVRARRRLQPGRCSTSTS